ncbi:hypothetical protein, partial [Caldalkalibacillus thermarum]|uniref:hypothetical protein n=1 Tax=Caldalkalibacillus thermarum TaxID=296745 RepID=UPI001ED9123D
MAEQSQQAAAHVTQIITAIQTETHKAVETAHKTMQQLPSKDWLPWNKSVLQPLNCPSKQKLCKTWCPTLKSDIKKLTQLSHLEK